MRAIVITEPGGPDVLRIAERPMPETAADQVLIAVKAFGLNQAEVYFRRGAWGEVAEISGIECVGVVQADPSGRLAPGQRVAAVVGGMGRSINGSYAEFVAVPTSNVVALETALDWPELAAVPETYLTAWTALAGILRIGAGQTVLIRGAGSALGQAAVNIAARAGARVIATVRRPERADRLREMGASDVIAEHPTLAPQVRSAHAPGADAVLDIVGTSTVLDSLAATRRGGGVCLVGFLGGGDPLTVQPIFQMAGGRMLSVFATALDTGSVEFPLDEVPWATIVDRVADGTYKAKPAAVFSFDRIVDAHRLLESGEAGGKIVVTI
jgi:NADPH:quinone reductase-like Zn-dependent oxidoreductase